MTTRSVDDPSSESPAGTGRWYRRENLVRLVKFGIVGTVGVGVNWGAFEFGIWAFASLGERLAYAVGVILGIVVSIFANFVFNDIWTWGDRAKRGGLAGWMRRMGRYYVAASAAGLVQFVVFWASLAWVWEPLGLWCPGWTVPAVGAEIPEFALAPRLSLLTGIGAGMAINFLGGHLWAFRDTNE